jgi:F-type H+-transporting ATPase subunit b
MPQLDTSQYGSQLFWFFLCFAVLYIFASRIILPRIRNILNERKNVIDADLSSAASLDDKIYTLQQKTDSLRKDASQKYQIKLDEVSKDASVKREKMLLELKEKIEQITEKSRSELKDFIAKSHAESEAAIKNLSQKIKEKLFN